MTAVFPDVTFEENFLRWIGWRPYSVRSVPCFCGGGGEAIAAAAGAPYTALTTIDDVYPDRPDRA